jgi:alpha-ketoglutarate-dependent taurine dioxygenase
MLDKTSKQPVPKLNLTPFLGPNGELSVESQSKLVAELIALLRTPPYWLVFVTEQNPIDLEMLIQILQAMGQSGQTPEVEPPRISRTKVRVDPQEAARKGNVTRYSRTPDSLPLHTDCSNNVVPPPNLVAFAMERPDPRGGGESVMLSAADFIQELPEELVNLLRQPVFPFVGNKRYPILHGEGDELRIRYYRNQITSSLGTQQALPDKLTEALDELDRYLNFSQRLVRFHMQAGDVVMMDNQRVMHGRSDMPANSERLMHRFRLSLPALSAKGG